VAGRFNSHFKDALLVFVDEGFWGGDKKAEGALKGMVTEDHIEVEGKYKDPFRIKNNSNFIFASNNDWVIPAAFEERRFFVMNVLEKRMCDSHYFKRIYEEMDNGGREAMLHDLLHYDISNFDLRKFPRGEALFDQIVQSMPTVKKFWYELLRDGNICSLTEKSVMPSTTMWPTEYPSAQLYQIYLEFSSTLGDRYRSIDKQFGKHIKQLCPGIKKKKRGLERYYIFPTLSECRQQFEKLVNMKVDWGKDEDEAEDE
jgi:phage/plasmid-associated DNA primase